MGELDIVRVYPDPAFISGARYAFLTVFLAWIPLAVVGFVLGRTGKVHATMRGAAPLRVLARLAIAVQVGAIALTLLVLVALLEMGVGAGVPWHEVFLLVVVGVCVLLPITAISAAGIVAWHRMLVALTSMEGEGRMLV